jgi:hypothetical protein
MDDVQSYDPFDDRAVFEYKYSFIPRRCYTTGQWVWGVAMRGRRIIGGPGDPVVEDRWYHRHEAIIKMLKG